MVVDPAAAEEEDGQEEQDARDADASVSTHSMGSPPRKLRRPPSSRTPMSSVSIAAIFSDSQAPGPGADAVAAQLASSLKVGGCSGGWAGGWVGGWERGDTRVQPAACIRVALQLY